MKQIDNRQKQQIHIRAEKIRINKNVLAPKGGDKGREPLPFQGDVSNLGKSGGGTEPGTPYRAEHQAGRNDPCPCGSGKKYKKCCLLNPPAGQ
ncbi:MAG TPA: SEC-C metal-binding domain-containing protein [Candidatus Omnitrophota bacterium]|nr:SEC-C metal-binding domain-containing protein [Candidatus Omnitrophota bacterium]